MADAITIPSPSAFLKPSTPPSASAAPGTATASKHVRRSSSTEAKKKKADNRKPPNKHLQGTGADNVVKPKQSKSRNGCVTCKAKRLKCGEEKPGCTQCARRNVECGGYKKDFKWRPFEETNVKINFDRQRRVPSPNGVVGASSKPTTPVTEFPPKLPRTDPQHVAKKDSVVEGSDVVRKTILPQRPAPSSSSSRKQPSPVQHEPSLSPTPELTDLTESTSSFLLPNATPCTFPESIAINALSPDHLHHRGSLSHLIPGLGHSPTLTETLLPFDVEDPMQQDFIQFELPEGFQVPTPLDSSIDPALTDDMLEDDDIAEIVRNSESLHLLAPLPSPTRTTPASSSSPGSQFDELLRRPLNYTFPQQYYADDSPEMLTLRFDKLTCGILSIIDGQTENPWRSLIWPLALQSPALYHAITAMTAFHSATDVPRLRVVGHEHKAASIRLIQEGIRDNSFSTETAIATALALGFGESWDQHTTTGNTHIKGAQVMVRKAIAEHRQNPKTGIELARLKFLCNAWVYLDVIARLTSVDSDDSNDFDNTFIFSGNPNEAPPMVMGDHTPGFGIDFGLPIDARLDPLMGCANTLFPLIGRVANLVRKVCRSQKNSPPVISQANELKIALEAWDPPAFIERPEDPTTDVQHTIQTAEAYRWATLLHLHQSVPELPSLPSSILAQRVLTYIATVPLASRTVIVQIYPLMVAGCEAETSEDRQWVRSRWAAMHTRMRIGIIEKCATVTEEVWRRRDAYEAQPTSHRKLVATADLHPSRTRGQPFVRTPTGSLRLGDPGRTGMVFSYVDADGDDGDRSPDGGDHKHRARDRRNGRDPGMRAMDPAYTVRGHLHWVGVMWDWGWEILLG